MNAIAGIFGLLLTFAQWGLMIAIVVETIVYAYYSSGIIMASISFLLPVISQVYYFFKIGFIHGFDTRFHIMIYVLISIFIVKMLCVMLIVKSEDNF